jgi:hypothetical protein
LRQNPVVNLPVLVSGQLMGAVKILHDTGYRSAAKVRLTVGLHPAAVLVFCSLALVDARQS